MHKCTPERGKNRDIHILEIKRLANFSPLDSLLLPLIFSKLVHKACAQLSDCFQASGVTAQTGTVSAHISMQGCRHCCGSLGGRGLAGDRGAPRLPPKPVPMPAVRVFAHRDLVLLQAMQRSQLSMQ